MELRLLSRETLLAALIEGLRENPLIYAFWLEGADAHDLVDAYSDLDLWLDVEDGQGDAVFDAIRTILSQLAPLDFDHESPHPHPQLRQAYFHLLGTSEFLGLDVCLQDHSRPPCLREGFVDDKVRVLFDKCGATVYVKVDWPGFQRELAARAWPNCGPCSRCSAPALGGTFSRGNYLEARGYYERVLDTLVELLRIRYQPTKHDFRLKHIGRDLPQEALARLESVFTVSSLEEMEVKLKEAEVMFEHLPPA